MSWQRLSRAVLAPKDSYASSGVTPSALPTLILEKSLFQSDIMVRKIPERFARLNYAIPIYQMGDTVTVATPIPDNARLKKQIEHPSSRDR